MLKNHTAILFDLDGTLLDSLEGILKGYNWLLEQHPELPRTFLSDIQRNIGRPISELLLKVTNCQKTTDSLTEEFRAYYRNLIPTTPLFPNVKMLLLDLKKNGYRLGLVTSKGRVSTTLSLKFHDIENCFETILAKEDTAFHKPRPEPILKALQNLGVSAEKSAYVGDTIFDVQAAKAAGCTSVAVLWGCQDREAVVAQDPHLVCESVEDLHAHLRRGT